MSNGTLRLASFFLALGLSIICPALYASTVTLDDSGSQSLEPAVTMRWQDSVPRRTGTGNLLTGSTLIRVRINAAPWLRHVARIYLALPAQQPGPIDMSWTAQGRFLSGQVHSGNRALVYAGPITTPFLEELFAFRFSVAGALLARTVPVTYHFELDE